MSAKPIKLIKKHTHTLGDSKNEQTVFGFVKVTGKLKVVSLLKMIPSNFFFVVEKILSFECIGVLLISQKIE